METTKTQCPQCGAIIGGLEGRAGEVLSMRCPLCGAEIEVRLPAAERAGGDDAEGYATRPPPSDLRDAPYLAGEEGRSTLFQPSLMLDSIADDASDESVRGEPAAGAQASPEPEVEPYFLVRGAVAGEARTVRITSARTTFGRELADVTLDDDAASAPHFQIDVLGREYFVRDLDSHNGTYLNGHRIYHSEILPGDELRVGETVLIFRTSEDGLG